jgi:hypothetical protein
MKTQISRYSHNPARRYSGVWQQQGRMLTDADWNELQAIAKARLDAALRDAMGTGVPSSGGLSITEALKIVPGAVYAGGLAANLPPGDPIDYRAQPDFPLAPGAPSAGDSLYVDAWEREVLYLEDSALQDPGLRGADTCSRTQTMLQIKRAPAGVAVDNPAINPPIGDALVTLKLREAVAETDVFDPYASSVAINEPVGNFVFRVEIHDVVGSPSAPTAITLKWSGENAAEAWPTGAEPTDFKGSDWIYEFYGPQTEKHLGVHFFQEQNVVTRPPLLDAYPAQGAINAKAFPFVRRWDGFMTITRKNASAPWDATAQLTGGKDRGSPITAGASSIVHGHYEFVEGVLHVNLQSIDLQIDLNAKRFVAGDYWLATVRDTDTQGKVLLQSSRPIGALHGYLRLGTVVDKGGGKLGFQTDRAFIFPTLSELVSRDAVSPGAGRIGADAITGTRNTLAAGSVRSQVAALLKLLDEHLAAPKGAHAASAISADASTDLPNAVDVQAQLSGLILKVRDLLVLFSPDGASKVGDKVLTSGSRSIAAGTVRTQLEELLKLLSDHTTGSSSEHDGRYLRRVSQQSFVLPDANNNKAKCFYTSENPPDLVTLTYNELDAGGKPTPVTIAVGGKLASLEARIDRDPQPPDNKAIWHHLFVTNNSGAKLQVNVGVFMIGPKGAVDREGKHGKDTSAEDAKARQEKDAKDAKDGKEGKEGKEQKENTEKTEKEKQEKGTKDGKDGKEGKEQKENTEKAEKEKQEKGTKDGKDNKESKEQKESKEKADSDKQNKEHKDNTEKAQQEKQQSEKNKKDSKEAKEDKDKPKKEGLGAKETIRDKPRDMEPAPVRNLDELRFLELDTGLEPRPPAPAPTGRAFIRPDERPPIGERLLQHRPPEAKA